MRRIGIALFIVALVAGTPGCSSNGDNLPPASQLEVRTWYDLDAVKDNLAGSYALTNDLDSGTAGYEELAGPTANAGGGWEPIRSFAGTFSGGRHEIRDLFINRPDEDYVGLFGYIDRGVVEGVGIMKASVVGREYVGALAGLNVGAVRNSYSIANITGQRYLGGLIGLEQSGHTVSNSYYDHDEGLINGENLITIGALYHDDFEEWLSNDEFLNVDERLSQEGGYYLLNDVLDFKQLLIFGQNSSLKFRLTADLDLAEDPGFYIPYLAGELDGNGHKVSNVNLSCNSSPIALFGSLASEAKITGLGVENISVTGQDNIGGIVAANFGAVSNCYATGNVSGHDIVGGLVGLNAGTLEDSDSTVNVAGMNCVGILVGYNLDNAVVTDSYSTGGSATGNSVGGVAGWNCGAVAYSCSTADVIGDCFVGGVVGYNSYGTVTCSYSTGSVSGNEKVGGVVGYSSEGSVTCCYSDASVTGNLYVGGLVGRNSQSSVADCYSSGAVAGGVMVGGLIGDDDGGILSRCFWDIETSGQTTSAGGTGKPTVEMQDITTFLAASWNITPVADDSRDPSYIWNIIDSESYPFLSWQPIF